MEGAIEFYHARKYNIICLLPQYLKYCTKILVMEKGAIVERGNHDTLMSLDGYYSGMIKKFHNKDESNDNASKGKYV